MTATSTARRLPVEAKADVWSDSVTQMFHLSAPMRGDNGCEYSYAFGVKSSRVVDLYAATAEGEPVIDADFDGWVMLLGTSMFSDPVWPSIEAFMVRHGIEVVG